MKQNATIKFLFFFFYTTFSIAQAPIALSDEFDGAAINCQFMQLNVLANDYLPGQSSNYVIDLEPFFPGIQSSTTTPLGVCQTAGPFIIFQNPQFSANTPSEILQYSIWNTTSGMASASASVRIITNLFVPVVSKVHPSCDNDNDGSITLMGYSFQSSAILKMYKDNTANLVGTYTVLAGTSQFPIQNLGSGTYFFEMNLECGAPIYINPQINLYKRNPITGTIAGTYQDFNNDGVVNLGDVVNININLTNTSVGCPMNDVQHFFFSPSNTTPGTIAVLAPGATDNGTLNYQRPITQNEINNGAIFFDDWVKVSNPGVGTAPLTSTPASLNITDGIKFNAFIDSNNNGIQDNGEPNYTDGTFSYEINAGETHHINTGTGIHYLYETNTSNQYALHYNINPNNTFCGSQYVVAPASYPAVSVAAGSGMTTYNFAVTAVTCNDVAVSLYSNNRPRPGFNYTNTLVIKNEGNQTMNGAIAFDIDPTLTFDPVTEPEFVVTSTGFSFTFSNLAPGESRSFPITMHVPTIPTVALGQLVTNSVSLVLTDINALNNTAILSDVIIGSFDPNDKTESHGGKIVHSGFTADDYLTYTIRFENTGTAEAISVRVNDQLDAQLDETSIRMVKASHPYVLSRIGNSLSWRFDGIGLPASVEGDEITGHGYIVFQVKPKPGFALGEIIPNFANIYFDFNPAIVTNTCTTEFVPFLGVDIFDKGSFDYYPNPTSSVVTFAIKGAQIDKLEIIDVLGKTLISKGIQSTEATIDLSNLNSGIYFAKLRSGHQEKTVKLIRK